MIVSINQPAYLPWPGYFDRIMKADTHVVLDHVQFEKNSLTNRNKIKTPQGWSWLTVPVKTKGKFKECPIKDIETNETMNWAHKHWQSILSNYKKAPFFSDYADFFEKLYSQEWLLLNDILTETNNFFQKTLDIETKTINSSSLNLSRSKSELVLEICQNLEADTYLSGPLGRDYLNVESFHQAGVKVLYHDYQYPDYPQMHGDFEPYLSVIDLLFNCGPDSRERLQNSPECLKPE